MLRSFLLGATVTGLCFGVAGYLVPAYKAQHEAVERPKASAVERVSAPMVAAYEPSREAISDMIARDIEARTPKLPDALEMVEHEPVDREFAEDNEPKVWELVSKLEGVQSAVVQCHTYHCKVTATGDIKPGVALDVRGLTYRGNGPDGVVFLYNPDLAEAE